MRKDALEDYTNRGFSSCLRRLKSENVPEAPSVLTWHRFTYSSICGEANGQLNLRSFKGRESFGTNISHSHWYFWKAPSLCKKLFCSWRKEQLIPNALPEFPNTIVIITIVPEQFGIRKSGVELVRKAGLTECGLKFWIRVSVCIYQSLIVSGRLPTISLQVPVPVLQAGFTVLAGFPAPVCCSLNES